MVGLERRLFGGGGWVGGVGLRERDAEKVSRRGQRRRAAECGGVR